MLQVFFLQLLSTVSICCCAAVMCDNGQVYDSCGPPTEPSCENVYSGHTPAVSRSLTVEGCYCPPGTVRNGKLSKTSLSYMLTGTEIIDLHAADAWSQVNWK